MENTKPMTLAEYKAKLSELHSQMRKLAGEFALSNNTVKMGDIVTDHIGSVKVEVIGYTTTTNQDAPALCTYEGPEVTKKGIPFKSGSRRLVYQGNMGK